MDEAKRTRLVAAGYKIGDVADFLGMDDAERAMLELRREVKAELRRLGKVTSIEVEAPGDDLESLVLALLEAGGRLGVVVAAS